MSAWDLFHSLTNSKYYTLQHWKTTLSSFSFDELCWGSQRNELALRRTGRDRPGVFILCILAQFLLSNTFILAFGVATVLL